MRKTIGFVLQGTFAAAVLAVIGFGATQAAASPASATVSRACDDFACYDICVSKGFFTGECTEDGVCRCG